MRKVHTPKVNEARKKHQRPFVNSFIIYPIELVIILILCKYIDLLCNLSSQNNLFLVFISSFSFISRFLLILRYLFP